MEWKSRRREVPERLEPSLSSGALAEEEGLDRFLYHTWEYLENLPVFQLHVSRCIIQSVSDLQYFYNSEYVCSENQKTFRNFAFA